jgi:predicted phage gp36 major capsid-like protein
MTDSEQGTERTVVKTYVPAFQRSEWDEHAAQLDMSRSEFVRTMVQAGRRGFTGSDRPGDAGEKGTEERADDERVAADLESTVADALSVDEFRSWEELRGAVTDDIERRLEETLQELQADGRVRYSGRNGGYTLER